MDSKPTDSVHSERAWTTATAAAVAYRDAEWGGVGTRAQLLPDLPATVLLHAGPPYEGDVPLAVLQAAALALEFERTPHSVAEIRTKVMTGALRFEPAQNHGVVTPLAQVVSASMPLAIAARAGPRHLAQ